MSQRKKPCRRRWLNVIYQYVFIINITIDIPIICRTIVLFLKENCVDTLFYIRKKLYKSNETEIGKKKKEPIIFLLEIYLQKNELNEHSFCDVIGCSIGVFCDITLYSTRFVLKFPIFLISQIRENY